MMATLPLPAGRWLQLLTPDLMAGYLGEDGSLWS